MNTSLRSTVDGEQPRQFSIQLSTANNNSVRQAAAAMGVRGYAESSCASILLDATNLDTKSQQRLPSFQDSEPPSYFDVIGCRNFSTTSSTNQHMNNNESINLPKIVLHTASSRLTSHNNNNSTKEQQQTTNPSTVSYAPNHRRMHVLRSHNLPASIVNQNPRYYSNSNLNGINNSSCSIQKPCETYLAWSIFTTVYCVLVGLPALIFSIKVHHLNKQGEYDKAFSRSKIAKYLNVTGLFFGFVYMGIVLFTCFATQRP
jgi:hypothetical protein